MKKFNEKINESEIFIHFTIFILGICAGVLLYYFVGCDEQKDGVSNREYINLTDTYFSAIISLDDHNVVEGNITRWSEGYSDNTIQVEIDGKIYHTTKDNVVMISE